MRRQAIVSEVGIVMSRVMPMNSPFLAIDGLPLLARDDWKTLLAQGTQLWLRPVIARVDAGIISCLVDRTPVGPVDAASIGGGRAVGEGASDLDPTVLKSGHVAD